MPGITLPNIPLADVQSRNTSKSCYVTIGTKVFDITDFIEDHPGGGDLILQYGGKDVGEILRDEQSHHHSESAYEILDDHLIGFMATDSVINAATKSNRPSNIVPLPPSGREAMDLVENGAAEGKQPVYVNTGMSCEEDLTKETDVSTDYKTHKFLDLSKPLLMQVWNGGFDKEFYLEQVHRPRHYRGGESAPLFGNFLEPLSKTPWWVVPTVWLPPVAYGTYIASRELSGFQTGLHWALGLFIWTLVEYGLHRCLFHLDE
jgi:4-hydroxysphinganine ceramide fatty acyl 2-hydroxylase